MESTAAWSYSNNVYNYCHLPTRAASTMDMVVFRIFDMKTHSVVQMYPSETGCFAAILPKNLAGRYNFNIHTIALAQDLSLTDIDNLSTQETYELIPCTEIPPFSDNITVRRRELNAISCENGENGSGKWTLIPKSEAYRFKPLIIGMSMKYRNFGPKGIRSGPGKLNWDPHLWEPEACSYRIFQKTELKICLKHTLYPILFIGDSLLQFYPIEIKYLLGQINGKKRVKEMFIFEKHRGQIKNLLPRLSKIVGRRTFSTIVLNSGAWDLISSTIAEYEKSLRLVIRELKKLTKNKTRIIWRMISAPKLFENKTECAKYPQRLDRVVRMNSIATSVLREENVEIFDVFPSSLAATSEWYDDNLHLGTHNAKSGVHAMHVQMLLNMLCGKISMNML